MEKTMTLEEQINFLTRGCVDVVSKADLAKKLESLDDDFRTLCVNLQIIVAVDLKLPS